MEFKFLDLCVIKKIFGFPCPGCGMTRALISAVKLDFPAAFDYHPLFWTIPIMVIAGISYTRRVKKWNTILIIALCLLYIVVYIIRIANGWRG